MASKWAATRKNLIAEYGLAWRLDETEWSASFGNKPRLVGERDGASRADFWDQFGFYVLYMNDDFYRDGVARHLGNRLRIHSTSKEHGGRWNRFHWFGFKEVDFGRHDRKGFLVLNPIEKERLVNTVRMLHDFEGVLERCFNPQVRGAKRSLELAALCGSGARCPQLPCAYTVTA